MSQSVQHCKHPAATSAAADVPVASRWRLVGRGQAQVPGPRYVLPLPHHTCVSALQAAHRPDTAARDRCTRLPPRAHAPHGSGRSQDKTRISRSAGCTRSSVLDVAASLLCSVLQCHGRRCSMQPPSRPWCMCCSPPSAATPPTAVCRTHGRQTREVRTDIALIAVVLLLLERQVAALEGGVAGVLAAAALLALRQHSMHLRGRQLQRGVACTAACGH
jgi:hypothetical protein